MQTVAKSTPPKALRAAYAPVAPSNLADPFRRAVRRSIVDENRLPAHHVERHVQQVDERPDRRTSLSSLATPGSLVGSIRSLPRHQQRDPASDEVSSIQPITRAPTSTFARFSGYQLTTMRIPGEVARESAMMSPTIPI